MIALIFGGSGFVGRHLYSSLKADGRAVRILDIERPSFRHDPDEYAYVDVRRPIDEAVQVDRGASTIYNLAAIHRTPGHPADEYYTTNVLGALNVTEFATRVRSRALVFTSSISVYGPGEDEKTERSAPAPTSSYGKSKLMAEEIHRRWSATSPGSKLVIVRPAVLFGPHENGNFTRLYRALKTGLFLFPGRTDTIKSCGYVMDLLDTFEYALALPDLEVLYNFCYPQRLTIKNICDTFAEALETPQPMGSIPYSWLRAGAYLGHAIAAAGVRTPVHPERIDKLYRSTNILPAYLMSSGYKYRTDLRAALLEWSKLTDGRMD
jgi:GlcNAc-P-P-Und epimerase